MKSYIFAPLKLALFTCFSLALLHTSAAAESGVDVTNDGGNVNVNINFDASGVFRMIKNTATDGIKAARKTVRGAGNLIRSAANEVKRRLRRIKNRVLKLKRKLTNEKKRFARLSKRIIAIAKSGGDVPPSLGQQAGASAGEIYQMQAEIQKLRYELEIIKQQERQREIEDLVDRNR